jgi:hypothetical protein
LGVELNALGASQADNGPAWEVHARQAIVYGLVTVLCFIYLFRVARGRRHLVIGLAFLVLIAMGAGIYFGSL